MFIIIIIVLFFREVETFFQKKICIMSQNIGFWDFSQTKYQLSHRLGRLTISPYLFDCKNLSHKITKNVLALMVNIDQDHEINTCRSQI